METVASAIDLIGPLASNDKPDCALPLAAQKNKKAPLS
jgi:hypothetical protein